MITRTFSQPENQLGIEIGRLLDSELEFSRIVFVSAFVGLRTILRFRERLLEQMHGGTRLVMTVGIDLGGTSRDVLEELHRWGCDAFVFHNTINRATFHPKVYLFQSPVSATLFVGSNNLTDGGLYTNYEATTCYSFDLPTDDSDLKNALQPLAPFIDPQEGPSVRRLDTSLISALAARGELPTEAEAKLRNRALRRGVSASNADIPASPFSASKMPFAPLLPQSERKRESLGPQVQQSENAQTAPIAAATTRGILVWRKKLPKTDALQVGEGTNPVGGVRLTQAKFEYPPGRRIDQTTYFRVLFADYSWENEAGKHTDQEHTFVPMRVVIRGKDHGIRNVEISHKPSGEAGQKNYTTILKWGCDFTSTVQNANLTDTIFSLYESPEDGADFLIEIN